MQSSLENFSESENSIHMAIKPPDQVFRSSIIKNNGRELIALGGLTNSQQNQGKTQNSFYPSSPRRKKYTVVKKKSEKKIGLKSTRTFVPASRVKKAKKIILLN